ncbi:MAG: thioredoxin domain-containing protein [Blastocatellia bacterium]|nr:thioredoxin domain-containing protein [Blastocatellia bacterium]
MSKEPRRTNRLIDETSPYLLQHAHNPVDWYPWGDEAFERAKAEDKPVLVSIGYSACHWCHVMEHESFEDEAVAAVQNEHFVNIKVDMEERPDVDQIYMNFVQMTTGRGGWPMNVFITPDKQPFFGGTYFPPSPRFGMPSWQQILISIAEAWRERRDEIEQSVTQIVGELRRMSIVEAGGGLSAELLDAACASHVRTFDAINGGFGGAPKFPAAMSLEFLLRYHKRTGDVKALEMVTFSLDKMACGGIYDQIGGGFHRYAVDSIWLVPHFEKMLYDNAQLARVYLHAYQVTQVDFYKRIAIEILDYIEREMLNESGGFYSTQDADSEGEEGKFFVWSPEEIAQVLGSKDAKLFCEAYDITKGGNFEGHNILNLREASSERPLADLCKKLFDYREKRVKPGRDEKVLTAWNGLMLAAFADAAGVLGNGPYLEIAKNNAAFIKRELKIGDRLLRTWKDGRAKLNGYVEDYANVADGLLELFKVTGDASYLADAKELADVMITEFWDEENGGFFFTSHDHEELIVRNKDLWDNATPSGNSVAADVLLRLAKLTGEEKYERFSVTTLRIASSQIKRHPQGFGRTLSALEFRLGRGKEIVIFGESGNEIERDVMESYRPHDIIVSLRNSIPEVPLTKDRAMVDELPTAYVCEDFICKRPVTSVVELRAVL